MKSLEEHAACQWIENPRFVVSCADHGEVLYHGRLPANDEERAEIIEEFRRVELLIDELRS